MIGGMVIQILIQAALLQLSLKLIAKHEADTTFTKAAMVTAGITVGNFILAIMVVKISPLLIWPTQIAFTAAIIMTFCWISFWKSVIVVLVFVTVQVILAVIMALILGISIAAIFTSAAFKGEAPNLDYKHPSESRIEAQRLEQEAMMQEALRLQYEADRKRAQIEAEARRLEMEQTEAAPPAPIVQPSPPTNAPAVQKREANRYSRPPSYRKKNGPGKVDWKSAQSSLRLGGTMAGAKGYLALVNGQTVTEGDTVSATYDGRQYRWKITAISSAGVDFEKLEVKPPGEAE